MAPRPDKSIHILLVEDDDLDVENVRRAFRKANITNPLWIASDGEQALEMLRGADYPPERRLVLLDINLPRLTGIEVLREIRADERLRHLCVVVLTTSNEDRDRTEAYDLHVAGYLLKPVTSQSFVDLMTTLNRYWTLVEFP
jgi:CheY-like chemotaxis protein